MVYTLFLQLLGIVHVRAYHILRALLKVRRSWKRACRDYRQGPIKSVRFFSKFRFLCFVFPGFSKSHFINTKTTRLDVVSPQQCLNHIKRPLSRSDFFVQFQSILGCNYPLVPVCTYCSKSLLFGVFVAHLWWQRAKQIPTGLMKILISFCQVSIGYFVVNIELRRLYQLHKVVDTRTTQTGNSQCLFRKLQEIQITDAFCFCLMINLGKFITFQYIYLIPY